MKVKELLKLINKYPEYNILIFSERANETIEYLDIDIDEVSETIMFEDNYMEYLKKK